MNIIIEISQKRVKYHIGNIHDVVGESEGRRSQHGRRGDLLLLLGALGRVTIAIVRLDGGGGVRRGRSNRKRSSEGRGKSGTTEAELTVDIATKCDHLQKSKKVDESR